jgi:hypothetical protein
MSTSKFLYTELAITNIIRKNKRISDALNYSPTFWNAILSALQHSTFITLGRIFDIDPKQHSIHALFRIIENNKDLFTKESFKNRWIGDKDRGKLDDWLPKYLESVYVPTNDDFRKFKKFIANQNRIYENLYAPIRHQFGHRIYDKNEDVEVLFNKVQVKDLEKFCVCLGSIHEALWQLYHNGRGPLLPIKRGRYSTQNILKTKNKYKPYDSKPANVQFIEEATKALDLIKIGHITMRKR